MTKLAISHVFIKKLTRELRRVYGKEVKHTDILDVVAKCLGWRADSLMHRLKNTETHRATDVEADAPEPRSPQLSASAHLKSGEKIVDISNAQKGDSMRLAMSNAMRRNPKIIVIGECQDAESIQLVREASEIGFVVSFKTG
jgi:hypothetical protein